MTEKMEISLRVDDLVVAYKDAKQISIKKILNQLPQVSRDFTALRGVSFEVSKGEIVGICGKNGSGKSTLLNAVAGIFSADSGSIDLHGNSVSLLSIGVGFQKKLSGRDNIYLSGLLLGFTKEQIQENYDEIVAFSELGEFVDRPVSSYSSGMYSKLAFSITAILETDIMLIDEVFSVGDSRFKKKSYAKMLELIGQEHRTVLIVSHSLETLAELCSKVIWIDDGKLMEMGEPEEVIEHYNAFMDLKA
jgi:teichoic acid transport system ATP-binding protein